MKELKWTSGITYSLLFLLWLYYSIYYFSMNSDLGMFTPYEQYVWIDLFFNITFAIVYMIISIGCFSSKRNIQKAGFGLHAIAVILRVIYLSVFIPVKMMSAYLSNESISIFNQYCTHIALLAYSILLLMAVRVPKKAHIPGIAAAITCIGLYGYSMVISRYDLLDIVYPVLLILGSITFGFFKRLPYQPAVSASENETPRPNFWVCPECETGNSWSKLICSKCGYQRK